MALSKSVDQLKRLLLEISHDLEKSGRGNKAASQRVRTNTIKFAKIAKMYRKESVAEGRKGDKKKKTTKRKVAKKKKPAARKKKVTRKKTTRKKTTRRRR
ncbi:MAG: Histone H1-like protein HC1 [Chlamydiae bacterium]|nr:Histone H1-like protein HC1 [Chlamydiota bacterium]